MDGIKSNISEDCHIQLKLKRSFQISRGDFIKTKNDQYTNEWFKNKIYSMRNDIEILDEYVDINHVLRCRCKIHPQYIFSVKASTLSYGGGRCKLCEFEKRHLVGKKFGKLTVLKLDEEMSLRKGLAHWKCKCECDKNTELTVSQNSLMTGNTKSCGCLYRDSKLGNRRKRNTYKEIDEDTFVCITTNKNSEYLVDYDMVEEMKKYTWLEDNMGYLYAMMYFGGKKKKVLYHRFVMNCNEGDEKIIDHISGDKHNCLRSNLREVNSYQNVWNTSAYGTTGIKGVRFRAGKYDAKITYKGIEMNLGRFKTFEEAKDARINAEMSLYPEYRREYSV